MTVKGFIKKTLTHACVYFTVIMLFYIIIAAIVNVTDSRLLLEAGRTMLFFVFSLLLACANTIFSIKALSGGLRLVIHYLITAFGFYACFMLSLSLRASSQLVGLVTFTAVYFAVMGIGALISSRYRANAEKAEKYTKKFSNLKK